MRRAVPTGMLGSSREWMEVLARRSIPLGETMMGQKNILVYTSPTCGACKAAKEFFRSRGISFTEKDVTSDSGAAREMEKASGGASSVPVIVINGQAMIGFDQPRLEAALGGS